MDLNALTIESIRAAIVEKRVTPAAALVEQFYKKIKAEDPDVHAYLTLSAKIARSRRQNALTAL